MSVFALIWTDGHVGGGQHVSDRVKQEHLQYELIWIDPMCNLSSDSGSAR